MPRGEDTDSSAATAAFNEPTSPSGENLQRLSPEGGSGGGNGDIRAQHTTGMNTGRVSAGNGEGTAEGGRARTGGNDHAQGGHGARAMFSGDHRTPYCTCSNSATPASRDNWCDPLLIYESFSIISQQEEGLPQQTQHQEQNMP